MFEWLRKLLRVDEETIHDTWEQYDEQFDDIYKRQEKLMDEINELHLKLADIDDKVYPVVKKLSTRAAVRDSREKSETNINKRGGIMRYGTPQRS